MTLGLTQPLNEMSTRNISREGGGEILEPHPPGNLRACPGLFRDCFTFYPVPSYRSFLHSLLLYSRLISYALVLFFYALYLPALCFYDPLFSDIALRGQNINPNL